MPDLDSTAKSNFRNNVLNIVGWFITKFCPSASCLPCCDILRRIFGAETPKIEIAVQNMKKKQKQKLKFSGSLHFTNTSYHTKQEKIEGGVHTVQVIVKFSMFRWNDSEHYHDYNISKNSNYS